MSDIALPIAGVSPGLGLPGWLSSDERLARLASGGSERALTILYERHHQALYRYCRSIVRDHHDAQDALQSTMTHAFMALRSGERDLAVRPWLFRIAHNEAVSILRKRRPDDGHMDEHLPSDVSVERTVDQRERLQTLIADIQALPQRQRAALLMRELSGLSSEEIAAALSVSPGAAKQTVFEARSSLHELAEGRAMECETVCRAISDGDGRVLRGRRLRAHLRGCADCRDFSAVIDTRRADLRALAPPLPAAAATAMLARVLAQGAGGGHAGGAAAASGAALGNHAAGSLLVKGLAGVAVLAAASAGTLHVVRGPVKHGHASTVVVPTAPERTVAAGRTGATHGHTTPAAVSVTPAARSIAAAARAAHDHAVPGRGALLSTRIPSEDGPMSQPSARPAAGSGKTRSRPIHGNHPGRVAPPGARRSRAHRPPKPLAPSASPRPGGLHGKPGVPSSESGPGNGGADNGHASQAQQAPAGQPPAGAGPSNETQQPTTPPPPSRNRAGR
jgi:RNA polymerase sigma factor (sigma-70 family)